MFPVAAQIARKTIVEKKSAKSCLKTCFTSVPDRSGGSDRHEVTRSGKGQHVKEIYIGVVILTSGAFLKPRAAAASFAHDARPGNRAEEARRRCGPRVVSPPQARKPDQH